MADVLRERTRRVAEGVINEEKLRAALEQAFDATKKYVCIHCHRTNSVPMPDIDKIAKIIDTVEGPVLPAQVVHHDVTVMTLEQRIGLADELRARREALELPVGDGDSSTV